MRRVALVFPYFRTRVATEMLLPPLGVATLAAHLRRLGVETRVFDCTFRTLDQLRSELRSFAPDVVGISSMVSHTRNTFAIARLVRAELPQALLVAGGPLPTVFPRRYARDFDLVFRGEADLSFPRFCRDYVDGAPSVEALGELPLDGYDGLFVPNHGLSIDNRAGHCDERQLARFPAPDRGDFDHAAYQRVWLEATGSTVTSIIATLGCPFACEFCSKPIFGNVVRRRPLDGVLDEVDELGSLGYEGLWIADDSFTLDRPYLEEFCRRMASRPQWWTCLSRVDAVDAQLAGLMSDAGCRRVYLGLESGCQDTLRLMNKRVTVEDGAHAVRAYRAAGIEVAGFFIVGYPGETESSVEQTLQLALSLPLDEISFNVPYPLPGSALFRRLGGPDDGLDWTEENEVTFVYPSEFDAGWLRRRIGETMAAFETRR